jgi:hypothetical protein
MVLKKVDNRIRVLIENGVQLRHRSLVFVVGDKGKDQVICWFLNFEFNTWPRVLVFAVGCSAQQVLIRAWNNVLRVPDHGDRQSWLSLLCLINIFLPIIDRWSAVVSSWRVIIVDGNYRVEICIHLLDLNQEQLRQKLLHLCKAV